MERQGPAECLLSSTGGVTRGSGAAARGINNPGGVRAGQCISAQGVCAVCVCACVCAVGAALRTDLGLQGWVQGDARDELLHRRANLLRELFQCGVALVGGLSVQPVDFLRPRARS